MEKAKDLVRGLLSVIGEDPTREGLLETPERVVKAYLGGWASGYKEDPAKLFKTFEDGAEGYDGLVLVSNIPVYSLCEHHMAPFWGLAHIGYVPNGRVVGLSKFSRLVDAFARRLQVQERLTAQIADCISDHLSALAVGVVLECRHMCMESRGVQRPGVITTTSQVRGAFQHDPASRDEFLSLVRHSSESRKGL